MTIEESIKKDPSKFQAIVDTKEAAVKAAMQELSCRRRAILSENSRAILSSAPNVCCRVAAGLK